MRLENICIILSPPQLSTQINLKNFGGACGPRPLASAKLYCLLYSTVLSASRVLSTPDDGRRKRPKHVE